MNWTIFIHCELSMLSHQTPAKMVCHPLKVFATAPILLYIFSALLLKEDEFKQKPMHDLNMYSIRSILLAIGSTQLNYSSCYK
jgi:hypothetical protein